MAQRGDIVILATDGLFDNLFDAQIMELLAEGGVSTADPDPAIAEHHGAGSSATDGGDAGGVEAAACCRLALTAQAYGNDGGWRSPFTVRAEQELPKLQVST